MKIFCSFIILFSLSICSLIPQTWEWVNPYPQGNDLNDVAFGDESLGIAVGDFGTIIRTSDGGISWDSKQLTPQRTLQHCQLWDVNLGWILGDSALFLKTTDGGVSWVKKDFGLTNVITTINFRFLNQEIGYAWGNNVLLKSTDGGDSWFDMGWLIINELYIADELTLYATTDNSNSLIKSTDGGITWNSLHTDFNYMRNIFFLNDSTGWVCGRIHNNFYQYRTSNGGKDWVQGDNGGCINVSNVVFLDTNYGVGLAGSSMRYTTNCGDYWQTFQNFPYGSINNFTNTNTSRIWCVGDYGRIISGNPESNEWTKIGSLDLPYYSEILSINFIDSNYGIATCNYGNILITTDAGKTWTERKVVEKNILGSQFLDKNIGWLWDNNGSIYRTNNGGLVWIELKTGTTQKINQVFFFDRDEGWLIGDGLPLRITVDGGETWYEPVGGLLHWLKSIYFVNRNIGWAVGSVNKTEIIKTTDAGYTWVEIKTDIDVLLSKVFFFDDRNGIVSGEGKIYKTSDGGFTWTQIFSQMVTIKDFNFVDKNNGWILFGKNNEFGFYYTRDGGDSWILYPNTYNHKLNGMHFSDINTGWAVGDIGIILKFTGTFSDINTTISLVDSLSIFPNPAEDYIEIIVPRWRGQGVDGFSPSKKSELGSVLIRIFDLLGMEITTPSDLTPGPSPRGEGSSLRVDVSHLSPGVYFVRVGDVVRKFVKI